MNKEITMTFIKGNICLPEGFGGDEMQQYLISLNYDNRVYTFDYYVGLGNVEQSKGFPGKWVSAAQNVSYSAKYKDFIIRESNGHRVRLASVRNETKYRFANFRIAPPNLDDVLQCILFEANDDYQDFEDFCMLFGYSEDSRSAFSIFEKSLKARKQIKKLLGADFQEFVEKYKDR